MDDKRIIELLFLRDEAALGEIERRYGSCSALCRSALPAIGQDARSA